MNGPPQLVLEVRSRPNGSAMARECRLWHHRLIELGELQRIVAWPVVLILHVNPGPSAPVASQWKSAELAIEKLNKRFAAIAEMEIV